MNQDLILNSEYIATHISNYIREGNLFSVFDIDTIKTILKFSNLTTDEFIDLLRQSSSTLHAYEVYRCTRKANISIRNFQDVISIIESFRNYMKLRNLDGIIDFLKQAEKELFDSTQKIQKLQKDLSTTQNQKQREFLSEFSDFQNAKDFQSVYNFLDYLSSDRNQKIISKACEEELCKKIAANASDHENEKNVLHVASETGNLKLVKFLINCGCDKEEKDKERWTPFIYASSNGHLEVVKYLISVGANKDAKDKYGRTPLIYASTNGHLEVVKYLISVGANKEAKDNDGRTPLIYASSNGHLEVVKNLISIGADKEVKSNYGWTPLTYASFNDHLNVVKYLISVGADKETKDNDGRKALNYAKGTVENYLKS